MVKFNSFILIKTSEYKEIFLSQYCLVCLISHPFVQLIEKKWKMEEIAHTELLRLLWYQASQKTLKELLFERLPVTEKLDTQATSGILTSKTVLSVKCSYLPELCQNRNSKASSEYFDLMPLKKFVDPLPEEIAMLFMFENILLEKMKVLLNCNLSI